MRDCGFARAPSTALRLVAPAPRPAEGPALVELAGVTKVFESGRGRPGRTALAGVSLAVAAEEALLLEGPSGSGKTTLLSLVGCMVRPTAGRIRVAGREVTRLPEELLAGVRRRRFGFVFQSHHLIRGASVLDNVMLPALPRAGAGRELPRRARDLLARFGLADRAHERVERLSGGEQQRVALARALINDPPVVLADEPTAHLDAETAVTVLELLGELRRQGKTVLVASHDPLLRDSGCFDRRLELRGGRLHGEEPAPCC